MIGFRSKSVHAFTAATLSADGSSEKAGAESIESVRRAAELIAKRGMAAKSIDETARPETMAERALQLGCIRCARQVCGGS